MSVFDDIPQELETLDDVPEKFKPFYAKDGEAFRLKDLAPLTNAFEREKTRNAELKAQLDGLAGWKDLGDSPDTVKSKIAELEEQLANASTTDAAEEIKSIKDQMAQQHKAEKEAMLTQQEKLKAERDTERNRFRRTMAQQVAMKAIVAEDGIPELLLPLVEPHISIFEQGDKFTSAVLQEDGKTKRVDGQGSEVTPEALVKELKANPLYQGAFKGTKQAGMGTAHSGNGAAGKSISRAEFEALPAHAKYEKMKEGFSLSD